MIKNKVVLVSFPFDDLTAAKVRPAVCLTEPIGPHNHVVLAFITSRIFESPLPTDLTLRFEDPEFSATGLRISSTLQLHRLMTATTALLQRELGFLPSNLQEQVTKRLRSLFAL